MSNFLKISFLNPFKFYKNTITPGIHFDDDWTCNRIKSFEMRAFYFQKWKRGNTTPIQVEATAAPDDLKIYGADGKVKKTIAYAMVAPGLVSSIYEVVFDIDSLPDGTYYLYIKSGTFEAISEPVRLAASWPNTLLIKYQHSQNKLGITFITGVLFSFRCEAGIMDYDFKKEISSYFNQTRDAKILDGTPYRLCKLNIGTAPGVAPYVPDLLNRIFCLDYVSIAEKEFVSVSEGETTRVKGYPLVGWSMELLEAKNNDSLDLNDAGLGADGGIEAYDIDTDFFGNADTLHITDIETN